MTEHKYLLHGTRFLDGEPTIDQELDAVPPEFSIPTTEQVLAFDITDYNRIRNDGRSIALGRLAVRMLNSFFIVDPRRQGDVTTADILHVWEEYDLKAEPGQTGPVLRGLDALDAIRQEIDGLPFVYRGTTGSGHTSRISISPDIIFNDLRF